MQKARETKEWRIAATVVMAWLPMSAVATGGLSATDLQYRDVVIKAAWAGAKKQGPADADETLRRALKAAEDFQDKNRRRSGAADRKKEPIYEAARQYFEARESALQTAEVLLEHASCRLIVRRPSPEEKRGFVKQVFPLSAERLHTEGALIFGSKKSVGPLEPIAVTADVGPGPEWVRVVEVNFFSPRKGVTEGEPESAADTTLQGIGVKETEVIAIGSADDSSAQPTIHFASQVISPTLKKMTAIAFGAENQYLVTCD